MASCKNPTQVLDKYVFELGNCLTQTNYKNCYQEYIDKLKKVYNNDKDLNDQIFTCAKESDIYYYTKFTIFMSIFGVAIFLLILYMILFFYFKIDIDYILRSDNQSDKNFIL